MDLEFLRMIQSQEKIKKGRSLYFKDTKCHNFNLCKECFKNGLEEMKIIYSENPICCECRSYDVYLDFVDKYKNVILYCRDYGIEDNINSSRSKLALELRKEIIVSQIHYGLTLINLEKIKNKIEKNIINFKQSNSQNICLCNIFITSEILEKRKQKLEILEKYLKNPNKELQETYFKLASVMNKDIAERIINEANEKKIMNILEKTQKFIYYTQSNEIVNSIFQETSEINIILYEGTEKNNNYEIGKCFKIYW